MAVTAEQLNIILAARDREFSRAMTANQRRVERFARRSQRELSTTGKAFDALGSVAKRIAPLLAGAFTVATINGMVRGAAEIGKLAAVAGLSVEEFQRFSAGAKTVGFEMDKVSDIMKDVNDKFGEYIMNGEGQLVDFFEKIAPAVGVTAEQFRKLSGPQALQLYVDSLQKAGLSQQEMTFYMEALANDATALLPLLRDGGREMRSLADEAESAGRILSQDAVDGARDLEVEMDALKDTIATQLTTAILDHQDDLKSLVTFITDTVVPAVSGLITAITDGVAAYNRLRGIETAYPEAKNNPGDRERDREGFKDDPPGDPSNTGLFYVDPETGEIGEYGAAPDIPGVTTPDPNFELEPTLPPVVRDGLGGGDSDTKKSGGGSSARKDALREIERIKEEYADLLATLDPVIDAQQRFDEAQRTINAAVAQGFATQEEANAALAMAAEQFKEAKFEASGLKDIMDGFTASAENGLLNILNGTTTLADGFRTMANDIINELMRVLVVQRMVGSFEAGGGGIAGMAFKALSGRASGGSVMAGNPYMVGEHGREPFIPAQNGRILSRADAKQAMSGGSSSVHVSLDPGLRAEIVGESTQHAVKISQGMAAMQARALGSSVQNWQKRGTSV